MKKKNGLLLISALSALILSGCTLPGLSFPDLSEILQQPQSESSSQNIEESSLSSSKPTYSREESSLRSSSTIAPISSSKSSSSSSSSSSKSSIVESSSEEPVVINFSDVGIDKTYYCAGNSISLNSDNTTSWGTSTDRYPASIVGFENGFYHIVSDDSVITRFRVDVFTDGQLIYVLRNGKEFVMANRANDASESHILKSQDGSIKFLCISTVFDWRYFVLVDGSVCYQISGVDLIKGNNLFAQGSIFRINFDRNDHFFEVLDNSTIADPGITNKTYFGDRGSLRVYKDAYGSMISAFLNGVKIEDEVTLDDNVITVYDTSNSYRLRENEDIICVTKVTNYILDDSTNSFQTITSSRRESIIYSMTGTSGTVSGIIKEDGHLWAKFTAPSNGILNIDESFPSIASDSFVYLYEMSPSQTYTYDYVDSSHNKVFGFLNGSFELTGGITYLLKISDFNEKDYSYTFTNSQYIGAQETFNWSFTPNNAVTYTGERGDLVIETNAKGTTLIYLGGVRLYDFSYDGGLTITYPFTVYSGEDLTPIPYIATITIDLSNDTYTYSEAPEAETYPFDALDLQASSYSGYTDESGNMWVMFTPTNDGVITINGTIGGQDYAIAIYDLTSSRGDFSTLTGLEPNSIAHDQPWSGNVNLYNVGVIAQHTYVIKYGHSSTIDVPYGGITTNTDYVNNPLSFNYAYTPYFKGTFFGAEGNLVVWLNNSEFIKATLDGDALTGNIIWENNTLTIRNCSQYDLINPSNPTVTVTETVFTIDNTSNSYVRTSSSSTSDAVCTISGNDEYVSGYLGQDGNIWASFTPTENGFISIDEISKNSSDGTILAIYEKKTIGASWSDYANYSGATDSDWYYPWDEDTLAPNCIARDTTYGQTLSSLHDIPVEAHKTYIIKIGSYYGDNCYIGKSLPVFYQDYVGLFESFHFSFYKPEVKNYSGSKGNLELTFLNNSLASVSLDGETIDEQYCLYDESLNTLTIREISGNYVLDEPLDPYMENIDGVYELDSDNGSYSYSSSIEETHLINEIEDGVEFTGTTGKDGCYYAKFTAPKNGTIKIQDLLKTYNSEYVIVYEYKPGSITANYCGFTNSSLNNYSVVGYKRMTNTISETDEIDVEAGKTYVIKVASGNSYNKVIGDTASSTYVGKTGTILLTFTPSPEPEFENMHAIGEYGYLEIDRDGDVSLDAIPQPDAIVSDDHKRVEIYGEPHLTYEDDELFIVRERKVFTLSEDGETYTVEIATDMTCACSLTVREEGTFSAITPSNGLGLIRFVAPSDGTYTIECLISDVDSKMGVYSDPYCTNLVPGTAVKDSALTNAAETITFDAVAGEEYFIKVSYYGDYNKLSALTVSDSIYGGRLLTVTVIQ